MKKKLKTTIYLIKSKIKKQNNKNWMDILRLAYMYDPKNTSVVLNKILSKDKELIKLANKLRVKK